MCAVLVDPLQLHLEKRTAQGKQLPACRFDEKMPCSIREKGDYTYTVYDTIDQ